LSEPLGNSVMTLVAIAAAVVAYGVMLLLTGGLGKDDMPYIPGGGLITRVMRKLKLWKV